MSTLTTVSPKTMEDESPRVEIFTDGACSGNPGVGGWGVLLRYGTIEKTLSGSESHTTNNRMELMAAIQALRTLKRKSRVLLTTDSTYLKDGITHWIHGWKKKNWQTSEKKPVKNRDLWEALDEVLQKHDVQWQWVRAHCGHPENERVDQLARDAITKLKNSKGFTLIEVLIALVILRL